MTEARARGAKKSRQQTHEENTYQWTLVSSDELLALRLKRGENPQSEAWNETLIKRRKDVQEKNEDIEKRQAELQGVEVVKQANQNALSATLAKVEQVKQELTEKEETIASLTKNVKENETRNDALMEEIKDLKRLEKVIEEKDKQFSVVQLQLNEANAEIHLRNNESFRLTTENTALQAEVDQCLADEAAVTDKLALMKEEKEKVDAELEDIKAQLTKKKKK